MHSYLTQSNYDSVNLAKSGVYVYSEAPDFEILLMGLLEEELPDIVERWLAKEVIALLSDTTEIEKQISDATVEIEVVADLVEKLVKENASKVQNQDDYEIRYQALTERYNKAKDELENANNELFQKKTRQKNLEALAAKMEELDSVLLKWSDEIWLTLIEEAVLMKTER